MIKAAFFDVDWTLYDHKGKRYIPSGLEAIKALSKKGIKVFLCSARPYQSQRLFGCFDLGIPWDGYIACAGGYAVVGKKVVRKTLMDKKDVRSLEKVALANGLTMEVVTPRSRFMIAPPNDYTNRYHAIYVDSIPPIHRYYSEQVTGCLLFAPNEFDEVFQSALPHLAYYRFHECAVDVQPELHEKGAAIKDVLNYLGFKKEEAVGFGDDFQDLTMKDACGVFVAMGNGKEEVKKAADLVTDPIDEDGILHGLERLGLL